MDSTKYERFTAERLFTIRRPENIDYLTQDRGMTESWTLKLILYFRRNNMVCDAVEMFSQTSCVPSDHHTEMTDSCMKRDDKDVRNNIFEYFCLHSPFPETKISISISQLAL
ncbi:hypothetical protein PR048_027790 [Dryococelus australis]|uniref:Uncharacterized protein n=1 Tax=Dryococelus australis TaxID=614101 RepID=A0ABQ9GHI9_9NEOP|nr:hypothetical protein PR048_027790 [Dryococelus australis]